MKVNVQLVVQVVQKGSAIPRESPLSIVLILVSTFGDLRPDYCIFGILKISPFEICGVWGRCTGFMTISPRATSYSWAQVIFLPQLLGILNSRYLVEVMSSTRIYEL